MENIEDRIAKRYDSYYGELDVEFLLAKLLEESGELERALIRDDTVNAIEELGDCVIVLSSIARLLKTTIPAATEAKIAVHEDRLKKWLKRGQKPKRSKQ